MLKELFEAISGQAVKAAKSDVINDPGFPRERLVILPNGSVEKIEVPVYQNSETTSLATIVDMYNVWSLDELLPEVWVSRKEIKLIKNSEASDIVLLPLQTSDQVLYLENPKPQSQESFIKSLKFLFSDAESPLIETIRRVKIASAGAASGEYSNTKRSVGKSIEQELTGVAAIPDYVNLTIPFVTNSRIPFRHKIKCDLDIDIQSEQFKLSPLPGEIERGWNAFEDALVHRVTDMLRAVYESPRVYLGIH